jgi:hypothetical protein
MRLDFEFLPFHPMFNQGRQKCIPQAHEVVQKNRENLVDEPWKEKTLINEFSAPNAILAYLTVPPQL